jgi:hypothetical protein
MAPPTRVERRVDAGLAKTSVTIAILGLGLFAAIQFTPEKLSQEDAFLSVADARFRGRLELRPVKVPVQAPPQKERPSAQARAHSPGPRAKTQAKKPQKPQATRAQARQQARDVLRRLSLLPDAAGKGPGTIDVLGDQVVQAALAGLNRPGTAALGREAGMGTRELGSGGGGPGLIGIGAIGSGSGPKGLPEGGVDLGAGPKVGVPIGPKASSASQPGLKRGEIQRVIARHQARIKHCYERALAGKPGLAGKLALSWTINNEGRVQGAGSLEDTLGSSSLRGCALRVVRGMSFPRPRGGGEVLVSFPFLFSQEGGGQ